MRNNGYVLVGILVAIAILMMLYAVNLRGIFGPSLPTQPAGVEQHPWTLEEWLVPQDAFVPLPTSPKLVLNRPYLLGGNVTRQDQPRGTVTIRLNTDGRVEADWQTDYTHGTKQYRLEAKLAGNIDIKQTYQDADGKDKRRLFVIAQGPYRQHTRDPQTGDSQETGTVWLLGYVAPDGRAEGTLTLTTDRQWAAVYQYAAAEQ